MEEILMPHVKYSIMELSTHSFAERLLYISSSTYGKDWVSLYHSHSFSELIYVHDGKGLFCSEEKRIPIKKDSLIIINPNIKHTEISSHSHPLKYTALGIDNLQFKFNGEDHLHAYNVFDLHTQSHIILPLLRSMLQEVQHHYMSYEQLCQHYLMILLLKITRITGDTFSINTQKDVSCECKQLKQYIDSHYHEHLTLDFFSTLTHQNKFHLSHKFTKTFGISPINYLLERRILHSKILLRTSNNNITEIARMTGFSSSNYFSQSFKKYTGLSPAKYRQKYNDENNNCLKNKLTVPS